MDARVSTSPVLYRRILGASWDKAPPAVRAMHDGVRECHGRARVARGGLLGNLVADIVGFPKAGDDVPVSVTFEPRDDGEIWTRTFAGKSFASVHRKGGDALLLERFGPLCFRIAFTMEPDRMRLTLRGSSVFGVPLPLWLAPRVESYEAEEAGVFVFFDDIRHPLTGRIILYQGWLKPA
ncbi:MAG: DUF4166 domain-containing protein [Pseudomonadota bacterium]